MAEQTGAKGAVTFQELVISNMYQLEALIRILIRKGLVTEEEILKEIRARRRAEEEREARGT